MKSLRLFTLIALFSSLFSIQLYAHHGKDFIFSQSAILPHPGDIYLIPKIGIIKEDQAYSSEIEPSILYGINHWFAFELHAHISNEEHGSFSYEATAPSLLFNFLKNESGLNLGLSMEYEISHSHHHSNNFESRISASQSIDNNLFAINIISDKMKDSNLEFGYSISAKRNLEDQLGIGIELQNNLDNTEGEIIGIILYNPNEQFDFNLGLGTGFNNTIDFSIYTSIIWEFNL